MTIHDSFVGQYVKDDPIGKKTLEEMTAIALNVRYLVHYARLMAIKSDINSEFLHAVGRTKDVEIAYPHLQLVTKGKTGSPQNL